LPEHLQKIQREAAISAGPTATLEAASGEIVPLDEMERIAIEHALRKCSGNVVEAAGKLGLGQATMYRKIKRYGIEK